MKLGYWKVSGMKIHRGMNIPGENLHYCNFVHHKSYTTLGGTQATVVENQQLSEL